MHRFYINYLFNMKERKEQQAIKPTSSINTGKVGRAINCSMEIYSSDAGDTCKEIQREGVGEEEAQLRKVEGTK